MPQRKGPLLGGKRAPNHWDNSAFPGQNPTCELPTGAEEAKVGPFSSGAARKATSVGSGVQPAAAVIPS